MEHQHYTQTERDDAAKVDRALGLLDSGNATKARRLLEEVAANSPQFYAYDFGTAKEVYIKFWSLAEYLGYVALTRRPGEAVEQEVIWLKSAYPRAYYHLAKLEADAGDDEAAAAHLDEALRLEPDHPECLLALAGIAARAGDPATSLERFDQALSSRPYMSAAVMARMLAGKAGQLVALGRHSEAEQCLEDSLKHGPGNELALSLQPYVQSVKAGNVTAPVSLDLPPEPTQVQEPAAALVPQEAPGVHEPPPAPPPKPPPIEVVPEVIPGAEVDEPPPAPPRAKRKKRWWQWWMWWK